jgi:carbon storage regulator
MLVLRRKVGEAIILNDAIRITILAIDRYRVKIGIDAPPDVIVVLEELQYDTMPAPMTPMPRNEARE